MFDSVIAQCTCGRELEFQSKAGQRTLARYIPKQVPPEIAIDIEGDVEWCTKCDKAFVITRKLVTPIPTVEMEVKEKP